MVLAAEDSVYFDPQRHKFPNTRFSQFANVFWNWRKFASKRREIVIKYGCNQFSFSLDRRDVTYFLQFYAKWNASGDSPNGLHFARPIRMKTVKLMAGISHIMIVTAILPACSSHSHENARSSCSRESAFRLCVQVCERIVADKIGSRWRGKDSARCVK